VRAPERFADPGHGLAVEIPAGWQRALESLTPGLGDPREILSVGTYPLLYRDIGCAHVPSGALADLGAGDAFVTVQERGLDPGSKWLGFPARPAHFGPELSPGRSEAPECVPGANFEDYWFGFADGDRHFHVLVAFGPDASQVVKEQAWQVLDSLEVDPAVRPDWRSAG
jgi:hypothetical protein